MERFKTVISKIPLFHMGIAENAVRVKAEENARLRGAQRVEEKDVVSAFFTDVPIPFYSIMIRLLDQNDIDYKKYGFPENRHTC